MSWMAGVQFMAEVRDTVPQYQDQFWGPSNFLSKEYHWFFLRAGPGCEVDH
jgi:hypothetical protein